MIRTPGSPEDSFALSNINYDPATAVVVGTAINVGGNILGADAAMASGEYTDAMYKRNAGIYDTKADTALEIGKRNVSMFDDAFDSQMASTEAALLNSGASSSIYNRYFASIPSLIATISTYSTVPSTCSSQVLN